jgi:hypothetical protein
MPNLWPNDFETGNVAFPARLLAEQAQLLAEITAGKVAGEVQYSEAQVADDPAKLQADLFVYAPAINLGPFPALSLQFCPREVYPVSIIYGQELATAANRDEFVAKLRTALRSPTTKQLVGQLLYMQDTAPLPEAQAQPK